MAHYSQLLATTRLILRLNDPSDDEDGHKLIQVYHDDKGANSRVGVNTLDDVQKKHRAHAPKQQYCTRSPAPKGLYHLIFLKTATGEAGEFLGFISLSFRDTMPYPDIGYSLFKRFTGKGYGPEAGRKVVEWWREVIGVRDIWTCALEDNIPSQRCTEKMGFVKCGKIDMCFGKPGSETWITGPAYVLPGMQWKEYREDGKRQFIRPTLDD